MTVAARAGRVLNFVLTGEARSGLSVVQSVVNAHADVVCHENLLHHCDAVRRRCHEGYFGPTKDEGRLREWFVEHEHVPHRYLNGQVFDNPLNDEAAVGLRLSYDQVARHDLFDLFERRCREGDFCAVHVLRNPVACFISLKQAERSGLWACPAGRKPPSRPPALALDAAELVAFARQSLAYRERLRRICPDALELTYRGLYFDRDACLRRVFEFLELSRPALLAPRYCRLPNRGMRQRVLNFAELRRVLPQDVSALMIGEDFF